MKDLTRQCPQCGRDIVYKLAGFYHRAIKMEFVCVSCRHINHHQKQMKEMVFERRCPECGKTITYKWKGDYDVANQNNSSCKSCRAKKILLARRSYKGGNNPFWGKTHSRGSIEKIVNHPTRLTDEYRSHMSRDCSGSRNSMYGRRIYDRWVAKHGIEEADKKQKERSEKISKRCSGSGNPMYGKPAPKGSGMGWKGWYKGWFFRSLRELSYMVKVIESEGHRWESAETGDLSIRFVDWAGHDRTYRADFLVDGEKLVEVKPMKMMNTPTNLAKKKAAIAFCELRGLKYVVEDVEPLSANEITGLRSDGLVVFMPLYDEKFRKGYAS